MNILKTSKILFDGLELSFSKYGFILNNKNREFSRSENGITQIIDFFFYKKDKHIEVKPEIRIRVEAIEKIYRAVSDTDGRPYKTIGNHLFEILRYIDKGEEIDNGNDIIYNWIIEDSEHIQKLIEVIPIYLEETILPYFQENSSVDRVDKLLNKYPHDISIHNPLYPLRANLAIIAAKLNGNREYENLLKIYHEELEEAEQTYKRDFDKLKIVLSQLH